jgi:hypothetical protein
MNAPPDTFNSSDHIAKPLRGMMELFLLHRRLAMSENLPNGPLPEPEDESRLTPEEVQMWADLEWAVTDPEVKKAYEDQIVAVYQRRVIAHGEDEGIVLAEAQRLTGRPKNKIAIAVVPGPKSFFAPRD